MDLIYRKMENNDFGACAREMMAAFKEKPWNEEWTYEQAYTRIDEIMSARVSRGYVACDGDQVVSTLCGRIMTYLDDKELWIDDFSVHPQYQHMGIGGKMLQYVREEMEKEGIADLVLLTEKGFPCVAFYKKNGFKEIDANVFMAADVKGK